MAPVPRCTRRLPGGAAFRSLVAVIAMAGPAVGQTAPPPDSSRTGAPVDTTLALPLGSVLGLPTDDTTADSAAAFPLLGGVAGDSLASSDSAFAPGGAPLTLDSLHMSPWERVWWGRRGAFRRVGLFPTHPDDPTADIRQVATVRRRMLAAHQLIGLAAVGSMALTVISGQTAYSTGDSGFHRATHPVTIGLYSAGATLALLSPPRLYAGGRRRVDTIQVHRWLAVGHMAGMILTPLLAPGGGEGRALHRALGYATFATFSAAMITVTFFR